MSISYRALPVGPIQTNCYIVWDTATKKAAIIDPGGDREVIIEEVNEHRLDVQWVLLTHGHFDHSYLVGDLVNHYSSRFGMSEADVPLLTDSMGIGEPMYDLSKVVSCRPTDYLNDGDMIELGESELQVMATPGHSPGGLSYATDCGIFCGDLIFMNSIGRTDFAGGSYELLMATIRNRILTLDDGVRLFPGHGPATTVGRERRGNPFLQ